MSHVDPETLLPEFGLDAFRPGQKDVISTVLDGQDCLCVMPTGGGKSLCYQLPAVAMNGLSLVVSPLIALMKDQVDALSKRDIPATYINSSLSLPEQNERMNGIISGQYRLVYIAPERLRNRRFRDVISGSSITMLAIDEAHCISEWGHDFRPDYSRIGRFREFLGNPTTIALTATATPDVRRDIVAQLRLDSPRIFVTGFSRPNLHFQVTQAGKAKAKATRLLSLLKELPGSGIIYASTRRRCEEVVEMLEDECRRTVGLYHAGLMPDQRKQIQEKFMAGDVEIIVATNAFGMGIDKSALRFVIHYNMPGTLEAYYQEAGRAGRDGLPSRCMLLYSDSDRFIQEYFIDNKYPAPDVVGKVYRFLCDQREDPIEITLQEIKDRLGLEIGGEGVGTCEQILEKCGAIERLDSQQNQAAVLIDSDLPTLVDLLPKDAKIRRRVLQAVEKIVGSDRGERVYFPLNRLLDLTQLTRTQLNTHLRALNELSNFDYVPPFRGRAIHVLQRTAFSKLDIDFNQLEDRKAAEYSKLDQVVKYARSGRCRQVEFFEYFGDENRTPCGTCDNCGGGAPTADVTYRSVATDNEDDPVFESVRMTLSGVARADRRFGKQKIAQMLWGSKSKDLPKRLTRLTTFAILSHLALDEVVVLLEECIRSKLLETHEVERFRPVLILTQKGREVMRGDSGLASSFSLPTGLIAKLRVRKGLAPEPAPPDTKPANVSPSSEFRPSDSRAESDAPPTGKPAEAAGTLAADSGLFKVLRAWRTRVARARGWPVHRVFKKSVMEQIALRTPRTLQDLLRIRGIDPATVQQLGDDLLKVISDYLISDRETDEQAEPSFEASFESSSGASGPGIASEPAGSASGCRVATDVRTRPSFYWTWRLLDAGFTIDECEQIRGLSTDALLSHVLRAMDEGMRVELSRVLSVEQQAAINALIGDAPPPRIQPLLEKLPAGICTEHVQVYLKSLAILAPSAGN